MSIRIVAICAGDEAPDDALSSAAALAASHNTTYDIVRVAGLPANASSEQWAQVCAEAFQKNKFDAPCLVLAPPSMFGLEFSAYLATFASLKALGRCETIELDGNKLRATRSAFGGRAALTIEIADTNCIAQLRPVQDPPYAAKGQTIEISAPSLPPSLPIERVALGERQANLEGASLIVSGGRGLDAEGFALLEEIAAQLGGAVGASLPAVDAGLAPVSRQIGQSGKFVTPRIYVAIGLSGTPQHLAGIGEAVRIFALNKDPDAPIFDFAEIGLVADWRQALPLLRDRLANPR